MTTIHHDGIVKTFSRLTSGTPLRSHQISSTHRSPNALSGISAHTKSGYTLHIWTSTIYARLTTQSTQYSSSEERCESGHKVCPVFKSVTNDTNYLICCTRKLELISEHVTIRNSERGVIFQFLESLPNLQVLNIGALFLPAYLYELVRSIRHTSLLELTHLTDWRSVEGPPTPGLAGLEKLSIVWCANDTLNKPGTSLAHLYEFIRPTLTTLVELEIVFENDQFIGDLDLQLLKPAANTLRTFKYTLQSPDESVFDSIAAIFPHLSRLSIKWESFYMTYCIPWKACYNFYPQNFPFK